MNVEIFIVTCAKDLPYLRYALLSIGKFASGFSGTTVLYPSQEREQFSMLTVPEAPKTFAVKMREFDEYQPKGMLDHEAQILMADLHCPEADFIFHTDSDCVFREPFSPEDYFVGGNPVLLKESYARLKTTHPGRYQWQAVTESALGFPCPFETMCRHPMVNPRDVYGSHREHIERRWKVSLRTYYLAGKNEFPQDRAEFNSLGSFAHLLCPDLYHWIEIPLEERPRDKLIQFWSHRPPDQLQEIWIDGRIVSVMPELLIREILGQSKHDDVDQKV